MNRGCRAMLGTALLSGLCGVPAVRAETPSGYAFDKPQILTQQLIWGRAHGVRLLAEACQRRGDAAAGSTYLAWQDSQRPRLQAAQRDLARHYFAVDQASVADLDTALKLPPALTSRDDELGPACATFAEALSTSRYDLEKLYNARRAAILKGDPAFPGATWDEPDDAVPAVQGNTNDVPSPESPADPRH